RCAASPSVSERNPNRPPVRLGRGGQAEQPVPWSLFRKPSRIHFRDPPVAEIDRSVRRSGDRSNKIIPTSRGPESRKHRHPAASKATYPCRRRTESQATCASTSARRATRSDRRRAVLPFSNDGKASGPHSTCAPDWKRKIL